MSIDAILTQQIQTLPSKIPAGKVEGDIKGQLQRLGFLGILLTQLSENTKGSAESETAGDRQLPPGNPALSENPEINIKEFLSEHPDLAGRTEALSLGSPDTLRETLALNRKTFDAVLAPLSNGIITTGNIEAGSPRLLNALLAGTGQNENNIEGRIKALLSKLEPDSNEGSPGILAANLSPAELTIIQNQLQNVLRDTQASAEKGNMQESLDTLSQDYGGLALLFIALIPPQLRPGQAASQLAALQTDAVSFAGRIDNGAETALTGALQNMDLDHDIFERALQHFAGKKGANGLPVSNNAPGQGGAQQGPLSGTSILQGWLFTAASPLFSPLSFEEHMIEQFGLHNPGANVTMPGSLTNLVTHAQSAAHAHPATHMVAAILHRNATNGENKTLTLQLDPPDLGRVEVRMHFSRDRTLKASIIAEKPETHMMLQRDAHVLERALQDAGLENDGTSLSFELAQDDHNFGQSDKRGGSHGSGGRGADSGNDEDSLIKTTMTWHVDPETGHMRFNLLA